MGECIGLDFGTTYSVVARLGADGMPKAVDFGDEESSITAMESLLVEVNGEDQIGFAAVPSMRSPGAKVYKGFKLLLDSTDPAELKKNGYAARSPREVTTAFVKELFGMVRTAEPQCAHIDRAVVGVPYVWTLDGRDTKKETVADIVQQTTGAEQVEFFSEPTLACAYFVRRIDELRAADKKAGPYQGYVFVIDYGGGTLDVTLCDVKHTGGRPSISVVKSWGAGENTEGRIGSAGLAFMEKVAELTLAEAGQQAPAVKDGKYQKFVKDIEKTIKLASAKLKNAAGKFEMYFTEDGRHWNDEVPGVYGAYLGEDYNVRYGTLLRAYDESIRPVLDRVLNAARADMDAMKIPYDDDRNGRFKIATIGGFCNFALTELQIRQDTPWLKSHGQTDARYTELDAQVRPKDRELAIAYGAALASNELTEIVHQCPYTFYCYPEKAGGGYDEKNPFLFFREGDVYEPGKPMRLGWMEGDRLVRTQPIGGSGIPYICRERGGLFSEVKQPGQSISFPKSGNYVIAMALERSEKLTLYVYDAEKYNRLTPEERDKADNAALIGAPQRFPTIDELLGSFYKLQGGKTNV